MDSLFSFERLILLLIPLLFIFGGIYTWITAMRGRIGKGENPLKKQMTEEAFRKHRKREIISGTVVSLGMIALGAWLLYHWIFGPAQH